VVRFTTVRSLSQVANVLALKEPQEHTTTQIGGLRVCKGPPKSVALLIPNISTVVRPANQLDLTDWLCVSSHTYLYLGRLAGN
jgi:hypothetical protein